MTGSIQGKIQGKVVAITGGARGIGYATAQKLIAEGAIVAIGDIDATQLKQAGTELGVNTCPTVDVTSIDSFTDFLDEVERSLGPIDVLINNAGVMPVGLVVDEDDALTRRVLDINLLGVITGTKLALRRMQPRGGGHVINIASLAGETYFPGFATYCATKYGVLGFSDAARLESAGTGVAVSSVLPTFTHTELTSGIGGTKGLKNAEPEDIAAAIAQLIVKPKPRVRVTRLAGIAVQAMKFLPHRAAEAMGHLLGTDQFITRLDVEQRSAYEQRARGH